MKLLKGLRFKKYLSRIYLFIITTILVLIMIFSTIIYFNVEKLVNRSELENNANMLAMMKYNIDYMDEMVKYFSANIFYSQDASFILFDKGNDNDDVMKGLRNIKKLAAMSMFVKSIVIYNDTTKQFYTTDNGIHTEDAMLTEFLTSNPNVPQMKLVPRLVKDETLPASEQEEYVLSYFMFDTLNKHDNSGNYLLINVEPNWLYENIEILNGFDLKKDSHTFILGSDNVLIEFTDGNNTFKNALKEAFVQQSSLAAGPESSIDHFSSIIAGHEYLITFLKVEKADWFIIKAQLYDEVIWRANQIKKSMVLITLIFLGMAFIIGLSISRGIYSPFGKMVSKIDSNLPDAAGLAVRKDELGFLDQVYSQSLEQLSLYKSEKQTNQQIMKKYFLNRLLLDSSSLTAVDLEKSAQEYGLDLFNNNCFALVIFTIDNYKGLNQIAARKGRELIQFYLANEATKILAASYKSEIVELKGDQTAVLLSFPDQPQDFYDDLAPQLRRIQARLKNSYGISATVSISSITKNAAGITGIYNKAINNALYSFIFGQMAVITPDMVAANESNNKSFYNPALDKKIAGELKSAAVPAAHESIDKIMEELAAMSYNNIIFSLMHLINTLKNAVEEINQARLSSTNINYGLLIRQVTEMESLAETKIWLKALVDKVASSSSADENEKTSILVTAAWEIIEKNYTDSNLCLQQIADMLGLSAAYLGRKFKEETGLSVAECITDTRLDEAVRLLQSTKQNISQIVASIGMENTTYFYKVFKKKFGATPREYLLKTSLDSLD